MAKAPKNPAAAPEPEAQIGDNSATEDAVIAAWTYQHRDIDSQIEKFKEKLKGRRALKRVLRARIEGAGWSLADWDECLADSGSERVDLAAKEDSRSRLRAFFALPRGAQPTRPFGAADGEHGDDFWCAEGLRAGKNGIVGLPPPECPEEFHQAWLRGWGDGQAILAEGLKRVAPLEVQDVDETEAETEEDGEEAAAE